MDIQHSGAKGCCWVPKVVAPASLIFSRALLPPACRISHLLAFARKAALGPSSPDLHEQSCRCCSVALPKASILKVVLANTRDSVNPTPYGHHESMADTAQLGVERSRFGCTTDSLCRVRTLVSNKESWHVSQIHATSLGGCVYHLVRMRKPSHKRDPTAIIHHNNPTQCLPSNLVVWNPGSGLTDSSCFVETIATIVLRRSYLTYIPIHIMTGQDSSGVSTMYSTSKCATK